MATIEPRRNTEGVISYRVKVRLKGQPVQHASFHRLTDARRWAQSVEAAIREGRHFKGSEARKHTLADAIDRYAREVFPHKAKAGANQNAQRNWWQYNIGAYVLADVTPALLTEWRTKLVGEPIWRRKKNADSKTPLRFRTHATVVRYLAALSHVFTVTTKSLRCLAWTWARKALTLAVVLFLTPGSLCELSTVVCSSMSARDA